MASGARIFRAKGYHLHAGNEALAEAAGRGAQCAGMALFQALPAFVR